MTRGGRNRIRSIVFVSRFAICVLLLAIGVATSAAENPAADPAEGTTFLIYGPRLRAGTEAVFYVAAVGPDGRLVSEFGQDLLLRIVVSGAADVTPALLGPEAFEGGGAPFVILAGTPGEIVLSLYHHTKLVLEKTVTVLPGVSAPDRAPEGASGEPGEEKMDAGAEVPPGGISEKAIFLNQIVALAGDEPITADAVEEERAWEFLPDWGGRIREDEEEGSTVTDLIDRTLMLRAATAAGITVPPEETDAEVGRITEAFGGAPVGLRSFLLRRGLTEGALRRRIEEDLRIRQMVVSEVLARIVVSEEDVEKYYASHGNEFSLPEERRVRLITISSESVDTPEQRVRTLLGLLEEGVSFEVLAREHSEGGAFQPGGDIGWVRSGDLSGELGKVVFGMEPASPGIVEYPAGTWHVVEVTDVRGGPQPLAQVAGAIRERLISTGLEKGVRSWIIRLRDRWGYEILPAGRDREKRRSQEG